MKLFTVLSIILSIAAPVFADGYDEAYQSGYQRGHKATTPGLAPLSPLAPYPEYGKDKPRDGYDRGVIDGAEKAKPRPVAPPQSVSVERMISYGQQSPARSFNQGFANGMGQSMTPVDIMRMRQSHEAKMAQMADAHAADMQADVEYWEDLSRKIDARVERAIKAETERCIEAMADFSHANRKNGWTMQQMADHLRGN